MGPRSALPENRHLQRVAAPEGHRNGSALMPGPQAGVGDDVGVVWKLQSTAPESAWSMGSRDSATQQLHRSIADIARLITVKAPDRGMGHSARQ